jgi:hypothetical protein
MGEPFEIAPECAGVDTPDHARNVTTGRRLDEAVQT